MGPAGSYLFGPFRFDPDALVLWREGEVVPLTPKALALLGALLERGGDVVTKAELMARVWPDTAVQEANLSVTVAMLRKALGSQVDGRPYVATLPRRGYRFSAPLRRPEARERLCVAVLPFRGIGPDTTPTSAWGSRTP
jgi:DNA-binding winged helix-turn-helix (wHTH) protein